MSNDDNEAFLADNLDSSVLLNYWLSGAGGEVTMNSTSVDSYISTPKVKAQVDAAVRQMMSSASPTGVTESGWDPSHPYLMTGKENVNTGTMHALGGLIMQDEQGTPQDWYLALDGTDFRVRASESDGNINFTVQVAKYYSFDHTFKAGGQTFKDKQLADLNNSGMAQNYYLTGVSDSQTISVNP